MDGLAEKGLKEWRNKIGISAEKLAGEIGIDVSTYYKYENGSMRIPIDTMFQICSKLGDVSRWCEWMMKEFPKSYGKVHTFPYGGGLLETMASTYIEIADMLKLKEDSLKDALDGTLTNAENLKKMRTEIQELSSSLLKLKIDLMEVK